VGIEFTDFPGGSILFDELEGDFAEKRRSPASLGGPPYRPFPRASSRGLSTWENARSLPIVQTPPAGRNSTRIEDFPRTSTGTSYRSFSDSALPLSFLSLKGRAPQAFFAVRGADIIANKLGCESFKPCESSR
jgi:hypothetical protein